MEDTEKEMTGAICAYFSPGMSSDIWTFEKDDIGGKTDGRLIPVNSGDVLTIFADAAGEVVRWKGTVDLDENVISAKLNRFDRFGNPTTETLESTMGFQRNMADEWADMFDRRLRAILVKAPNP